MSNKFIVKIHKWIDGILHVIRHFFDSIIDAKKFTNNLDNCRFKVYNGYGQLVDSGTVSVDTYA
jgi:hypothetical protein